MTTAAPFDDEDGTDAKARRRYERRKAKAAAQSLSDSKAGRDIGPLPPVENPKRRAKAEKSLRVFLETYFSHVFHLKWSDDHLRFIEATQRAITEGLLKAQAMPRGSGKSSVFERALIWGHAFGHLQFSMIVGANESKAADNLAAIKAELEKNDLLAADFPELCYPIRKLEGIVGRARGQILDGVPTQIEFNADRIVLPTVAGAKCSGTAIAAVGLTGGGLRGPKHTLPDGRVVRPQAVLLDDPQTRKSAASPSEIRTRLRIIDADLLGMAGPGETLSVLAAVTVIYRGDVADVLLDLEASPDWRGERCKLLYAMPSAEALELWDEYHKLRSDNVRAGGRGEPATAFYKKNRKTMDEGAVCAWPARKLKGDVSALQHAMNLYYKNREAFAAEYQNEPLDSATEDGEPLLTASEILQKTNGVERGTVPLDADHLVGFIDVMGTVLYWAVAAFTRDFRGYVVDYGTWPEQPLSYFRLKDAKQTLQLRFPKATPEGAMTKGLAELIDRLCSREFKREGSEGTILLDRLLVDEGYQRKLIHEVCRRSPHRRHLVMAKGKGLNAHKVPFDKYKPEDGVRAGDHWRLSRDNGVLSVLVDTNHWKSFTQTRLSAADGDPSSLTLFGQDLACRQHELIADHLVAEYRTVAWSDDGRRVECWEARPGRPDNHWLDCVVGCHVGASLLGCSLPDVSERRPVRRLRNRGSAAPPAAVVSSAAPPPKGVADSPLTGQEQARQKPRAKRRWGRVHTASW